MYCFSVVSSQGPSCKLISAPLYITNNQNKNTDQANQTHSENFSTRSPYKALPTVVCIKPPLHNHHPPLHTPYHFTTHHLHNHPSTDSSPDLTYRRTSLHDKSNRNQDNLNNRNTQITGKYHIYHSYILSPTWSKKITIHAMS